MVVPVGVSVGDFIAGIKLIHELADGLKEGCNVSFDFCDLVRELHSLERALIAVKSVIDPRNQVLPSSNGAHVGVLKQVVLQTRQTIDEFCIRNGRFVRSLATAGGSGAGVRDWLRKVEWRMFKREDV